MHLLIMQLEWLRCSRWSTVLLCRYELDGRDPNGYVGCLWAVCGVHDQVSAWRGEIGAASSRWLC